MTTSTLRKKVHQYIDKADDTMLKALYAMMYESDKSPLQSFTMEQYNKELELAERELAKGHSIKHADAAKAIKSMFGKKEIEISVTEAIDDTTYLLQSAANAKVLKTRMANVKAGKKLVMIAI